jgi:nucleotide-binding universal stress UspA family protein
MKTKLENEGIISSKKIIIGINLNFESSHVLTSAVSLFRESAAHFYIMHVIPINTGGAFSFINSKERLIESDKKNVVNNIENTIKESGLYFLNHEIVVYRGIPHIEILNFSKKNAVDLIVIGTHQKIGFKELAFGSISFSVSKNSICPVMLIPLKNAVKLSQKELSEEAAPAVNIMPNSQLISKKN